jgi:heat shock protein HtpX
MIVDDPLPNGFAIGKETLILSRTLYETANEDKLAAVIAHEFGHLHNGDSRRLGIAVGVSLISLTISAVAGVVLRLFGALYKGTGKTEGGIALVLLSMVFCSFCRNFLGNC